MSIINSQIEQIISTRKEKRLPQIEKEITFLCNVKTQIEELDSITKQINQQITDKRGSYYVRLHQEQF